MDYVKCSFCGSKEFKRSKCFKPKKQFFFIYCSKCYIVKKISKEDNYKLESV